MAIIPPQQGQLFTVGRVTRCDVLEGGIPTGSCRFFRLKQTTAAGKTCSGFSSAKLASVAVVRRVHGGVRVALCGWDIFGSGKGRNLFWMSNQNVTEKVACPQQ